MSNQVARKAAASKTQQVLTLVGVAMDKAMRDLKLSPKEQTRVRSRLGRFLSDRQKAPTLMKRVPRPGDRIYVDTQLYLSHGADDFDGGVATVTDVHPDKYSGKRMVIEIAERPGHGYYWDVIGPKQAEMKKRYGATKAHPSPDLHPSANTWD